VAAGPTAPSDVQVTPGAVAQKDEGQTDVVAQNMMMIELMRGVTDD